MPIEKSAGAVVFRKNKEIKYLLLHYPTGSRTSKDYWDLPKGHVEKGEKPIVTAKREIAEETGLKDVGFIDGFKETIKYFFKWEGKSILKFVTFYLAEAKTKDVKISWEHIGFKWLPYQEALGQLTFKNAKEILKKANQFLEKYATAN
jgi:8-oxo-dGTP pyrophosphatase MutT (NUDIX family)